MTEIFLIRQPRESLVVTRLETVGTHTPFQFQEQHFSMIYSKLLKFQKKECFLEIV